MLHTFMYVWKLAAIYCRTPKSHVGIRKLMNYLINNEAYMNARFN